jgi:hypothetical protein
MGVVGIPAERVVKPRAHKVFSSFFLLLLFYKALELSQALLERQPDMTTIWGFRRQLLEALFAAQDSGEHHEICSRELLFLNRCLERSYKSYGAWHHRQWTMLRDPSPPWAAELELCNKFLQLDSRNCMEKKKEEKEKKKNQKKRKQVPNVRFVVSLFFLFFFLLSLSPLFLSHARARTHTVHCWDYRRFLVKASQPADPARVHEQLSSELDFTTVRSLLTGRPAFAHTVHCRQRSRPISPTTRRGTTAARCCPLCTPTQPRWEGKKKKKKKEKEKSK